MSTCSNCRFYQPDGHYYGSCDRLNITVERKWIACQYSLPAFDRSIASLAWAIEEAIDPTIVKLLDL